MAINLKKFYDAAVEANTAKTAKAVEIQKHFEANETEKGLAMKPELDALTKKAKEAEEMYLSMRDAASGDDPAKSFVPAIDREKANEIKNSDILKSNEYVNAFFKALSSSMSPKDFKKSGIPSGMEVLTKALSETGGTPAGSEGGFLLPTDFNNMIIERRRQFFDLSQFVNVENVQAFSGWRAIEKAAAALPFTTFTNNNAVPAAEEPAFVKVTYQVADYGGFLPVPNDLLDDTPVNLMAYLSGWFGKKVVLTNNSLILAILNALTAAPADTATPKTALDTIKTVLNVTLDPDISVNATIFVNQDGFNFLDQLKDGYQRPLLQPDPTNDTKYMIKGRPVALLANRLLPSTVGEDTKTHSRIIIGDAKSAITLFARSGLEMMSTTVGGSAWANNNTEIRGIMRADCKQTDDDAVSAIDCIVD
jgi:HK97 family phage major capsid protein